MNEKTIPAGSMVELNTDLIGEGQLRREMDQAIKEAHEALAKRRERGQSGGSCKISVDIDLAYDPDMRDIVTVTHCVSVKTPKNATRTLVKEKAGLLLVQPAGSSNDDPIQQRLFGPTGQPLGVAIDTRTGEVIETKEKAVAGKIG